MVFSTPLFLFYFLPIFLVIYYLLPHKGQNIFLLIASILFYSWGAPEFILIVLLSIFIDFFIIKRMSNTVGVKRSRWLVASLVLNISFLLYFKYANFFVDNINHIASFFSLAPMSWKKVLLPIGISFFTFQKMSYSIDVYRGDGAPLKSIFNYALYILMFPPLIAGPIIRFKEIETQLFDRSAHDTFNDRTVGFVRFMIGLAKKVLIANILAEQVDAIFALTPDSFSSSTAWIGMIAYSFQIYFDFSGYSDMALGIGKMMGYEYPENFNFPYISQSISEFWRRWHITLGKWMKDYIYIPLGGNRVPVLRSYLNLVIVFLISGFWHGAAWTFVAWGIYHGIFLVADRLFFTRFLKKIGKLPATLLTLFVVMIGWVLFRSESISYAMQFYRKLFCWDNRIDEFHFDSHFIFIMVCAAIFSLMGYFKKIENFQYQLYNPNQKWQKLAVYAFFAVILFILSGGALLAGGFNPFIYFRF